MVTRYVFYILNASDTIVSYKCKRFIKLSKTFDHITDEELVLKYQESRDNLWLGIVFKRYSLMAIGVCMKYLKDAALAQDVAQQSFIKAIQYLQQHKVTYFKSWFYMVLKNECLMHLRSKKYVVDTLDDDDRFMDDIAQTDLSLAREEKLQVLEAVIGQLKPDQRECVELFYLQKLSYSDIAEKLGTDIASVRSFIQNGKRNLKILMENKFKELEK